MVQLILNRSASHALYDHFRIFTRLHLPWVLCLDYFRCSFCRLITVTASHITSKYSNLLAFTHVRNFNDSVHLMFLCIVKLLSQAPIICILLTETVLILRTLRNSTIHPLRCSNCLQRFEITQLSPPLGS